MKYPIITTRGIVVFPGHVSTLEIGRTVSLNAVDLSVIQNEAKLVLVSQRDVNQDKVSKENDIYSVGTLVSVKIIKQSENYKMISVQGIERVRLMKVEFKEDIVESEVEIIKSITSDEQDEQMFVNHIFSNLEEVIDKMGNMPKNVLSSLSVGVNADSLTNTLGHYLPLKLSERQVVLEEPNVNQRLKYFGGFLNQKSQTIEVDRGIDEQVRETLDAQQKEFLLREKMKVIKEELGDVTGKGSEIDQWKEMLKDKKYPKEVRERMEEEIKRFESMPPISAESHVSKGYIDWVMKLPWRTYSEENEDLNKAKSILDKHHFGLKKVKERIVEHLAVKINTKNSNSPILTLVGPPGVGKTSLGKSIAESVGREFIKVSLGGVRDEAEIRGHRRTYVGAMPGKIIQAINKAKTSNPIILLDELDKMSSDYKGDPSSAMLEVLDPEQNKSFQDHYIELEYDLSQIMFLATANNYENIPGPLRDRVETIWLDQYTSEEKLAIARDYIIPKVLKNHGLSKASFKISDKTISYIISKYTQEAGVRGLERVFNKLARKIVVLKMENKIKTSLTITEEKAFELLGNKQIYKEILDGKAEVGLTNGMYYSSVGGGVLPIEVSTFPSKNGGIKLTGSIKDVMKESLDIAVGYLRTNQDKYKINFDWENTSIQIHVPEGSVPKDGPSAGIAFTTAIISALIGKPVPRNIALTGEITLRGNVLMIGGLKEKTLGAVEAGVKKIFIPSTNERDIEDLAQKVKDNAEIIMVKNYSEVFSNIFNPKV